MNNVIKWRESLALIAVSAAVLFFHVGNYWSAHWYSKWAVLILFFSLGLAAWVGAKTRLLFFPIIAYALFEGWRLAIWPNNPYAVSRDVIGVLAIEKNALYAYIAVLMSAVFFGAFKREWIAAAKFSLSGVCLVSLIHTLLLPVGKAVSDGLYSGNPSMNGCLIAALLPFVWEVYVAGGIYLKIAAFMAWALGAVAIYKTGASVPIGVLGVSTVAFAWSATRERRAFEIPTVAAVAMAVTMTIGTLLVAHHALGGELINDTGRFAIWKMSYAWWHDHTNHWLGAGLGTTQIINPILQTATKTSPTELFLWMHNDWYQILFEMGYLGAALFLVPWIYLLVKAVRVPALFASFAAFSAMAVFDYPLRLPIHAFALLMVCAMIVRASELEPYP